MKLCRNKKVEDLNEKIESLQDRLELLEYEFRHPQPFKIGDRFDKDNIVTGVFSVTPEVNVTVSTKPSVATV